MKPVLVPQIHPVPSLPLPSEADSTNLAHRLKLRMRLMDMTATQLARRCDLKASFIYDILNGKSTNPSAIKLARLSHALGMNLHTLVTMESPGTHGMAAFSGRSDEDMVTLPAVTLSHQPHEGFQMHTRVETYSPSYSYAWLTSRFGVQPEALRCVVMKSDCLKPTLLPNDLLIIDTTQTEPSPPGIFAFFDGTGIGVKRLEYTNSHQGLSLRILSDNLLYPAYPCQRTDIDIIGRVVWFSRAL